MSFDVEGEHVYKLCICWNSCYFTARNFAEAFRPALPPAYFNRCPDIPLYTLRSHLQPECHLRINILRYIQHEVVVFQYDLCCLGQLLISLIF